jgi:hypothetical protein
MVERNSVDIKQNSNDRDKAIKEFNKLFENFIERSGNVQGLENFEILGTGKIAFNSIVTAKSGTYNGKLQGLYTHNQLDKIVKIFSQLKEPGKEEFIGSALNFACNIQYGDLRAQALSILAPILDGQKKVEFIEKVLYFTSNIQDEKERALVLSSLVHHLNGHDKEEIIEHILGFSSKIQYDDAKFQILSSLIPHFDGSKNEAIMDKALELVSGFISEYKKVKSFSLLLPYMDEERKEEILGQALELAFKLKDNGMKVQALSAIIPYLDESKQSEISVKVIYFKHMIKSKYLHRGAAALLRRAETLSSLAPYLDVSCSIS